MNDDHDSHQNSTSKLHVGKQGARSAEVWALTQMCENSATEPKLKQIT